MEKRTCKRCGLTEPNYAPCEASPSAYGKCLYEIPHKLGTFKQDTGGKVDVYVDDNGLLTI